MVTSSQNRFEINGFVDTNKQVWSNIEELASAANSFITYNSQLGTYAVVINQPTLSSFSFTDNNIIGDIEITQSGLDSTYNGGEIAFPNKDILGQKDSVRFLLDNNAGYGDYEAREAKNWLQMKSPYINDYIQAQLVLATEIKQSREDLSVVFSTDYSAIGITAGDVIDITNEIFDWTEKLFRVTQINEIDDDAGNIILELTCISYSNEQYTYSGFSNLTKTPTPKIQPLKSNTDIVENEAEGTGVKVGAALNTTVGRTAITSAGVPVFETISGGFTRADCEFVLGQGSTGTNNFSLTAPVNVPAKLLSISVRQPQADNVEYVVDGVTKTVTGPVPVYYTLRYSATSASDPNPQIIGLQTLGQSGGVAIFNTANAPAGFYTVVMEPYNATDLSATNPIVNYNSGLVETDFASDANGFGAALTVQLFLN